MRSLKHAHAFRRDAKCFLGGDLADLDYRNYVSPRTINQGDLAISQSVTRFVHAHAPEPAIELIRWGETKLNEATWSDFIIAGSGYVIFDTKGHVGPRLIRDIEFFKLNGIRPILFGVGINQPSSAAQKDSDIDITPATEANLRELLSMAKAISVRDSFTQAVFSRYTDKVVELIGDPALHLGHLYDIRHTARPNSHRRRPLIGLNLNFHGPSSTKLLQRNLPIFANAIKSIRDEHHCDFRYFVHYDTSLVIPKLLALKGIEMEVIQGDPEALIRGYAELDLNIGGMLHSCILAHSVDTPAIALAYDIKHRGFMELFGLERNCLPAASLTASALIDRVRDVLNCPVPHRETIITTRQHFERITHDFARASLSPH
ncbi:hypothetical protein ASD68_08760 [Rhodanobacter sp. Root627]|uniref:polysaccharide pyruvyl transferase family protein n=1 Tax=Rhodanobacter sp. Root627 TaxID=1736572 RepID=UPI0006F7C8EA|nr:polysaccharide pyruvyl transferase family protein [Rhodanobacter sp. Root627]KRA33126.1 hypothetical protein ASD68_08760 [Rhodanobacter sp. Root627]